MKALLHILLLSTVYPATAQDNNILAGRILFQNSDKQPAVGVTVQPLTDADGKKTDIRGHFKLEYTLKKAGAMASVTIGDRTGDNKQIEPVNPEALQMLRIPRYRYDTNTVIIVCSKGQRDKNIKEYEQKLLADAEKRYNELNKKYNQQLQKEGFAQAERLKLVEALDSITTLYQQAIKDVRERAIVYAVLNKDFANGPRLRAIELIEQGKFEEADKVLEEANAEDEYEKDLHNIAEARKAKKIAEEINKEADAIYAQSAAHIDERVERLKLQANLKQTSYKYKEAEQLYHELLKIYERTDYPVEDIATCYFQLGKIKNELGYYDSSIAYYKTVEGIYDTLYPDDNTPKATLFNNLGVTYDSKRQYDMAIGYYQRAIAIDKKFYGEEHPKIATSYNNVGSTYNNKKKYDIAISYYQKALVIDMKFSPSSIAVDFNNLGSAYENKGDYDKAISYYQLALDIGEKFHRKEHPSIAIYFNNIGSAHIEKRNYDTAICYFQQALVISKKFYVEEHPNIATIYNNLGAAHHSKKEYIKAIGYYQLALAINKKYFAETNPSLYHTYYLLAVCYRNIVDNALAITNKKKYIDQYEQDPGKELSILSANYNELGMWYYFSKEYDSAIVYYKKAYELDSMGVTKTFNNNMGTAYVKARNFAEAKRYFELYEAQNQDKGRSNRNWAMYYALKSDKERAIGYLQKAVEAGFNDATWIETDDSIESLRDDERYKQLLAELKAKQKQ